MKSRIEQLEPRRMLSVAAPPHIVFPDVPGPADGIIDVREFGVDLADNAHDDTAALQNAIYQAFANGQRNRIVYLPAGTYNVSNTLYWKDASGNWQGFLKLVGENRDTTILKLRDNTFASPPAYDPPPIRPNAVIYTAGGNPGGDPSWNPDRGTSNAMFSNCIWNLTIDIGSGNTGAVGIDYHVTNQGSVKDVKIISSDAQRRGYAGIRMTEGTVGPGMIKNVEITGFDYGIELDGSTAHFTLEHIGLQDQRVYGMKVAGQQLSMRDLTSSNGVTAIYMESDGSDAAGSSLTLVDAALLGGSSSNSAIMAQYRSVVFVRNVTSQGYNVTVNNNAGTTPLPNGEDSPPGTGINAPAGYVREYCTHNYMRKYEDSILASLDLPVKETPEFWSANPSDWASVRDYGAIPNDAGDDTAAIRAAIASGKPIIFFPEGGYNVSDTITVGGAVRKLFGANAVLDIHASGRLIAATPASRLPMFRIVTASHDQPIIFQNLRQDHLRNLTGVVAFEHASTNALVIADTRFYNNADNHRYINTAAPTYGTIGELFLEDATFEGGNGFAFNLPQNIYIRNFDSEGQDGGVNNGANLWILGLKTEGRQTVVTTLDGGKTEVLGGALIPAAAAVNDDSVPAFVVRDAALTLTTVSNYLHSADDQYSIYVREIRASDQRDLRSSETVNQYHQRIPVYAGYGGSGRGLNATYFDNADLTGPSFSRIDTVVDYSWGGGSPDPSIGSNTFSARWTGQVQPIESGNYIFRTLSDDGVRLWINGQLVINSWSNRLFFATTTSSAPIQLQAGQKYDLRLEYYENTGSATIRLQWVRPGNSSTTVIPARQLYLGNPALKRVLINGGAAQRSNVTSIALTFDQAANIPALISAGTIDQFVQLYDLARPTDPLSWLNETRFFWHAEDQVLLIDLRNSGGSNATALAAGRYGMRVNASGIVGNGGEPLLDEDGTPDGWLVIDRSTASNTQDFFCLGGDLDGDADVDLSDLGVLASAYGTQDPSGDADGDGDSDLADLGLLASHYGQTLAGESASALTVVETGGSSIVTASDSGDLHYEARSDPQRRQRPLPILEKRRADDPRRR